MSSITFPSLAPAPATYRGEQSQRIAFPLGGIGAGSVCLSGSGALGGWSIRNRPDLFANLPMVAVLALDGLLDRVLEGPVPHWRIHHPWGEQFKGTGTGGEDLAHGLRRCRGSAFTARFPFATVELEQPDLPVVASLCAWSPFIPSDADASSLPVAVLEYTLRNRSDRAVRGEFAWHARNLLKPAGRTDPRPDGFLLSHDDPAAPWERLAVRVACAQATSVDCAWPGTGQWMTLRAIPSAWMRGRERINRDRGDGRSPGASLFAPVELAPGASTTISVLIAWHAPGSEQRHGHDDQPCADAAARFARGAHQPWYAGRHADADAVVAAVAPRLPGLRRRTAAFADALHASTLPGAVLDAVSANLGILRSPTVMRQIDGRLWAWEGCQDHQGSCTGTCTHVWNYAQALPHLFPALERGLRETEFLVNQDAAGHQAFRASLPIRTPDHSGHAAADGQFGGFMKLHREWRINGDLAWLRRLWPAARTGFAWCVATWDSDGDGVLERPHHNTYDIEFSGAEPLSQGFYAGAAAAMAALAEALGEAPTPYRAHQARAAAALAGCWDARGWLVQRRPDPAIWQPTPEQPEYALLADPVLGPVIAAEGPLYQIGDAVLSDATTGLWLAGICGLEPSVDQAQVHSHLDAVARHNLRRDLSDLDNCQRGDYAFGDEGGLLVASWPAGGRPQIPMPYADEVWTGCEYTVACQLISVGRQAEGLTAVGLVRARHDGVRRNPFDEQECGHWYARALASYDLLRACTGARYDAVAGVLHLAPRFTGDFTVFLAWDGGFGTVGVRDGTPYIAAAEGILVPRRIAYVPCPAESSPWQP